MKTLSKLSQPFTTELKSMDGQRLYPSTSLPLNPFPLTSFFPDVPKYAQVFYKHINIENRA